jgi:hypothetical protein
LKYIPSFKKHNAYSVHLDLNATNVVEPVKVAEVFARHFQSVYNTSSPAGYHAGVLSSDILQLPPVSELDILKAIKCLRPSTSIGVDGIPGFITKGCSTIFTPLLKYIFDLSLSQEHFPMQWKKAVIVPILKKRRSSSVSNYRPITLLNNSPRIFEFVIPDHCHIILNINENPLTWFFKSKIYNN